MGLISPQQATDGVTAVNAASINNPINTIANEFNGNIDNSNVKPNAGIDSSKVAFTTAGLVVQEASTNYNAVATGSTTIPVDDTIPQNTEDDQYMSQAITPKASTNRLIIDVVWFGSTSAASADLTIALFQDSTANALAASAVFDATAGGRRTLTLHYEMAAGTTSATTFKVRVGASGASTTTFNGTGAARLFGGIATSNITILEVKA